MKKEIARFIFAACAFFTLSCSSLCGCADRKSELILADGTESGEMSGSEDETSDGDETMAGEENQTGNFSGGSKDAGSEAFGMTESSEAGSATAGNASEHTGSDDSETSEGVYVYICGEVTNPGVYILPESARICDAVDAAGGMTEQASRNYWNLAKELGDGEMIYIPTIEEANERGFSELDAAGDAASGFSTDAAAKEQQTSGISSDGRVNINAATKEELMTIPGIGETRADSIVAYRKENGNFGAIEDIMNVSGIKDATFQKIKNYITVD